MHSRPLVKLRNKKSLNMRHREDMLLTGNYHPSSYRQVFCYACVGMATDGAREMRRILVWSTTFPLSKYDQGIKPGHAAAGIASMQIESAGLKPVSFPPWALSPLLPPAAAHEGPCER